MQFCLFVSQPDQKLALPRLCISVVVLVQQLDAVNLQIDIIAIVTSSSCGQEHIQKYAVLGMAV